MADRGFSVSLARLLRPKVYGRAKERRRPVSLEEAREWLEGMLARRLSLVPSDELMAVERRAAEAQTPEGWDQLRALVRQRDEAKDDADEGLESGRRRRP